MPNLTGSFGLNFNVTQNAFTYNTGSVTQVYSMQTTVMIPSLLTTQVIYSLDGVVGTTPYDLNLNSLGNYTGTGQAVYMIGASSGLLSSKVYGFMVYNASTGANIVVKTSSTSPLFPASERMTIKPSMGMGYVYGNGETTGATTSHISIEGSAQSTQHSVYIIGV